MDEDLSFDRLQRHARCSCRPVYRFDGFAGLRFSASCEVHAQSHCPHRHWTLIERRVEAYRRVDHVRQCVTCGFRWLVSA